MKRIAEYRVCQDRGLIFAKVCLGRDIAADIHDLGGMAGEW